MENWILFGLYFLAMAAIGVAGARKTKNLSGFVVGGRAAGPWMSALTYGITYFSAVLFIGYAGKSGWDFGLWSLAVGAGNGLIGTYLAWLVLASRTREVGQRLKITTTPQLLFARYGSNAMKTFSAIVIFVFLIPYSASVYSGISYLFEAVLGISYNTAILMIALSSAVYLVLGGYLASLAADFVQGLFVIFGLFAMIIFVVINPNVGGFTEVIPRVVAKMAEGGILALNFDRTLTLLGLVLLTSVGAWGMPHMIHKFFGVASEQAIVRGRRISTVFCFFVSSGAYFIGSMSRLFMAGVPVLGGKPNYDLIVPQMLSAALPSLLFGMVMILVFSASVSTLSGITLTASSTLFIDLLAPISRRRLGKHGLGITRALCFLFIVVSFFLAMLRSPILVLMSFSWGTIAGSFLAPYLLGLWWKGMTKAGAWCGIAAGFLTSMGLAVAFKFDASKSPLFGVAAIAVSFIAAIIGSLILRKRGQEEQAVLEKFFDRAIIEQGE